MDQPIPIKQDLFRFVTLRAPELLSIESKEQCFIYHPNIQKSAFITNIVVDSSEGTENTGLAQAITGQLADQDAQALPKNYGEIRLLNTPLYDFATKLYQPITTEWNYVELACDIEPMDEEKIIQVWDRLFYELITKNSKNNRQAYSRLIIANYYVSQVNNNPDVAPLLSDCKVVIPTAIIDIIQNSYSQECKKELVGVTRIGIADYRKVQQEVCCYVPGEVSHIENVLAKEFKEKHTRNLVSTEITTERTTESEIENLTDTATATRNELSQEIGSVLSEDSSRNFGGSVNVSGSYAGVEIAANSFIDFSTTNSSSVSNTSAKNYAQEVTRKAVEKIVQKTKLKRTSTILKEFEENNRHGFDNRNGDKHVTGIYRWVDKIYTNRLINYGKRLIYDFTVPDPSEFYKTAINFKPKDENGNEGELQKPKSLPEIGLNSAKDITRDNYQTFGDHYGVELEAPLPHERWENQTFTPTPPIKHSGTWWNSQQHSVAIDPNYQAVMAGGNWSFDYRARTWNRATFNYNIAGIVGGANKLKSWSKKTKTGGIHHNLGAIDNAVPIFFKGVRVYTYWCKVGIKCHLKAAVFEQWQTDAYNKIKQAYEDILAEYERQQEEKRLAEETALAEAKAQNEKKENPQVNRYIEQRELKRACINLMMKPYCRKMGKDFTQDRDACEYPIPEIIQNAEYAKYIEQVKFFEQAFDWELMTYTFHPYYWMDECQWAEALKTKNKDLIFQAFLQAGMAHVIVPVKCEMSLAVAYYMETGDIYTGEDMVAEDNNDLYTSIAEELKDCDKEIVVEGTWDSRVPTTLTILQQDSALINEKGLPCCDRLTDGKFTNTLVADSNTLSLVEAPGD